MTPATWYVAVGGNDIFWRCQAPADAVGGRVAAIMQDDLERAVLGPNNDTPLPWTMLLSSPAGTHVVETMAAFKKLAKKRAAGEGVQVIFPEHDGVAVFSRPDPPRATLALAMQQQGIRTIAETDDNYFSDAQHNLFLRQQGAVDADREVHARSLAALRVNVFSTRWLRDRYAREYRRRFGKRAAKQVEMHVCRNHIPHSFWPDPVERDGPLRVGFMGSPSHVWDVNLAFAAFDNAKDMGCETWMVGYSPSNPDPDTPDSVEVDGVDIKTRSDASLEAIRKWKAIVDVHQRWIAPDEYHRAAIPFDIGIAPLWHNEFNDGKSDIKAVEYTISGAAVVCANTAPYNRGGWEHRVNCMMATSPREYAAATVELIRDKGLRESLVAAARDMVWETRNEDVLRDEWQTALHG